MELDLGTAGRSGHFVGQHENESVSVGHLGFPLQCMAKSEIMAATIKRLK